MKVDLSHSISDCSKPVKIQVYLDPSSLPVALFAMPVACPVCNLCPVASAPNSPGKEIWNRSFIGFLDVTLI